MPLHGAAVNTAGFCAPSCLLIVLTALLCLASNRADKQADTASQDEVQDDQRAYGAFLARLVDFQAAPVAAVLLLEGHLASLLREAASIVPQLSRRPGGGQPDVRRQWEVWVSWRAQQCGCCPLTYAAFHVPAMTASPE